MTVRQVIPNIFEFKILIILYISSKKGVSSKFFVTLMSIIGTINQATLNSVQSLLGHKLQSEQY